MLTDSNTLKPFTLSTKFLLIHATGRRSSLCSSRFPAAMRAHGNFSLNTVRSALFPGRLMFGNPRIPEAHGCSTEHGAVRLPRRTYSSHPPRASPVPLRPSGRSTGSRCQIREACRCAGAAARSLGSCRVRVSGAAGVPRGVRGEGCSAEAAVCWTPVTAGMRCGRLELQREGADRAEVYWPSGGAVQAAAGQGGATALCRMPAACLLPSLCLAGVSRLLLWLPWVTAGSRLSIGAGAGQWGAGGGLGSGGH